MSTYEKPPLGLKPRYIHDEERRDKIKEAIIRYIEANTSVPVDWIKEYNELVSRPQKDEYVGYPSDWYKSIFVPFDGKSATNIVRGGDFEDAMGTAMWSVGKNLVDEW